MGKTHPNEFVLIVMRVHLFPSRTQKLSSCTPTIVAGRLAVKIGNANTRNLHSDVEVFFYLTNTATSDIMHPVPKRIWTISSAG